MNAWHQVDARLHDESYTIVVADETEYSSLFSISKMSSAFAERAVCVRKLRVDDDALQLVG
jgi:hypothetical protein